jgi:hypothetical protein
MARVDFFIAGVQKAGTTALDAMLRGTPGIQMAARKELHFFDRNRTDWSAPTYEQLERHFAPGPAIRGEATPIYTYWPNCLERIRAYNPDAKLIMMLRHPAWRAYSHWRMEITRGNDTLSFAEAISPAGRARMGGRPHREYSYVERGFYAPQVTRLLSLFPRGQVAFLTTDGLWEEPEETLSAVCRFLGVPPPAETIGGYIVPLMSRNTPPLEPHLLNDLSHEYESDLRETMALTGLDLNRWLQPGYREPMAP